MCDRICQTIETLCVCATISIVGGCAISKFGEIFKVESTAVAKHGGTTNIVLHVDGVVYVCEE